MKQTSLAKLLLRSAFALAVFSAAWTTLGAQSASPKVGMPMKGEKMMGGTMMKGKMMGDCDQMMERKQEMGKAMMTQNTALAEQVAAMNRAPEKQKLGLMAGIVTQLAEQRTARDAQKAKMDDSMMGHMMHHMQMGPESVAQCPMMQGMGAMKGMDEKSDAQKQHHEGQK